MSDKLREEIKEVLEKYPTPDECMQMETGDCYDLVELLQRCSLKIEEQANEIEQLEIEAYGINP
jgi:hypothetical protein